MINKNDILYCKMNFIYENKIIFDRHEKCIIFSVLYNKKKDYYWCIIIKNGIYVNFILNKKNSYYEFCYELYDYFYTKEEYRKKIINVLCKL